jgi:acetyl-CoA carboxylase biotin carboxyl carrier protein
MAERSVRKKRVGETAGSEELITLTVADIRELFELMKANQIAELNLEHKGTKIHIVGEHAPVHHHPPIQQVMPVVSGISPAGAIGLSSVGVATAASPPQLGQPATASAPEPAAVPSNLKTVFSPMVGTFYRAPAPDADSFVEIGDAVDEDTVLCIIEAMKIMNEIKAEMRGTVRKALVDNGHPVEYNQPLFLVEPD